jgi:reductive dehalogenase
MRKLKEPTYKRFTTGPLVRFDDRNTAISRWQRGEVPNPDGEKRERERIGSVNEDIYLSEPWKQGRKGYEQHDYALTWAGRTIDHLVRRNLYDRDLEPVKDAIVVSDRAAITQRVKSAARWFGADLVGICEVNPSWIYSHWGDFNTYYSGGLANPGDPIEIPPWFKYAVVMAFEMDYQKIKSSPAREPASALGYAQMAFTAPSLATYIRELGYHAMPSGNDYAATIPFAIDAGLGELGRNGLLITDPFGPRVRICKVFTDIPLEVDSPIDIGVQAFCERCELCAETCPSQAIMFGERTEKPWDVSNNINVLKWPTKSMDCYGWWKKNGGSCAICIRVCPYNKPKGWLHSSVRKIVETTPLFDRLFVKLDKVFGYGKQVIR